MKRKQFTPLAMLFIVAFSIYLFYTPPTEYKDISGQTQGTFYNISYQDRPGRDLQPKIEQQLHKFDLSLSSYDSNSIISKINRNLEDVKLDKYFKKVFQKSEEVYHLTGGAFDITIGPIVNAWGFGPQSKVEIDSALIDSLLAFVGMDNISINGGRVVKQFPSTKLDVNAIAQGYSVDVIADLLERKGISNYMIEIGGEIKGKGVSKKDRLWRIAIDKPVDNNFTPGANIQAIVELDNKSIATSGNYRKFYEKDGVKYAHSMDPKTGYPVLSRLLSTTVMAKDCMTADAFATAFMIMGLEKSIVYLSDHSELDAYLIYSDENGKFKTYMTQGMKEVILKEM